MRKDGFSRLEKDINVGGRRSVGGRRRRRIELDITEWTRLKINDAVAYVTDGVFCLQPSYLVEDGLDDEAEAINN